MLIIIFCFLLFLPFVALAQEEINVDLPGLFQPSVDFRFNQDTSSWEYRRHDHYYREVLLGWASPLGAWSNYVGSYWWHNLGTAEPLPYGLSLLTPGDFSEEYLNVIRGLDGLDQASGIQYLSSINNSYPDSVTSPDIAGMAEFDPDKYKPQLTVKIGQTELNFDAVNCKPGQECEIGWISQYVVAVYKYGVSLAAVLAVVMIMVGGFIWLMSGGSSTRVSAAKDFIVSAMSGLLLALFSFMLLYMVNPRLVNLEPVKVWAPNPPERGDYGSQAVAATLSAHDNARSGGTGSSGGNSDINLWNSQNQPSVTQMEQHPGVERVTTYDGHDDVAGYQGAADVWPNSQAEGVETAEWLMNNHEELGVTYVMYNHHIWNSRFEEPKPINQWRTVEDRGGATANHEDHIHASFTSR